MLKITIKKQLKKKGLLKTVSYAKDNISTSPSNPLPWFLGAKWVFVSRQ